MKNTLLSGFAGIIVGALIMGFVMFQMAPGMMILEDESKFNFEETTTKLEQSVKDYGWKISKIHDLQKTMKKFGHDVKAVKVFELCHPDHAIKILEADEERIVSSLMPCRVAVYEKNDGKTYFSRMNSALMSKTMSKLIDEVMSIASKENEEILQVILK